MSTRTRAGTKRAQSEHKESERARKRHRTQTLERRQLRKRTREGGTADGTVSGQGSAKRRRHN